MNSIKEKTQFSWLSAFIIALLINIKQINLTFCAITGSEEDGFMSNILMICLILSFVEIFYEHFFKKIRYKLPEFFPFFVFAVIILIWYYATSTQSGSSMLQIIGIVLVPAFIVSITKTDFEKLLVATILLSFIALPYAHIIVAMTAVSDTTEALQMDTAYSLLPSVVSGIYHFVLYRKNLKWFYYPLYVAPVYYLTLLVVFGIRGPILCILVSIALLIFLNRKKKQLTPAMIILLFVILLVAVFFEETLILVKDLLNGMGVSSIFIEKTLRLLHEGDLSHGRDYLAKLAVNGFYESPLYGKGLNSFDFFTGEQYPHNFYLQMLYEGGLLVISLFTILFFVKIKNILKTGGSDKLQMAYFFSIVAMYHLLSANMWFSPLFWSFVGFLLQSRNGKVKGRTYINNIKV